MPDTLEFARSALREFKALERANQRRIAAHIDELVKDPFPQGCKKLKGEQDHYRVGDFRIIYRVERSRETVVVVIIGHCREVYR